MLQEIRRLTRSHETFKKILVSNDGSEQAFRALSAAVDVAISCNGAELHMIILDEVPRFSDSMAEVKGEIEMAHYRFSPVISKSKRLVARQGLSLHCHLIPLVSGNAPRAIVEFARQRSFDLIVIGLAAHSALYHRILGSTAGRVIARAPCTVLVVK